METASDKNWYPMGTVVPVSLDSALESLYRNHPRTLAWKRMLEQRGPGSHRFRHFRSYVLHVDQPKPGMYRGEGVKPADRVKGTDGQVVFTVTTGCDIYKKTQTFTVRFPREYSEGGEMDV